MAGHTSLLTMAEVNSLRDEDFINVFGNVIEHCSLVAAAVVRYRPFSSLQDFHNIICTFIDQLPIAGHEGILRSHPELAGRLAAAGQLTMESKQEQRSAGLVNMMEKEIELMTRLNTDYRFKFGFPFVICARLNNKDAILKALETRLKNSAEEERLTAIEEVKKIALLRLTNLVMDEEASKGPSYSQQSTVTSNL